MFNKMQLPSCEHYKKLYPLDKECRANKTLFDNAVKDAVNGKKFLVIVGPCSADNRSAVKEYATKLKQLAEKVSNKITIVMRVYTAKPRTDGEGYLGAFFHDDQSQPINIEQGIVNCRQMMLDCLKIGLPIADELLYPEQYDYLGDLVSYYSLGARSSMDALHRAVASGIDLPLGVKNAIDGDLVAMVKGVYAVSRPKTFINSNCQISTNGNKYAHAILRGWHDGKNFVQNISSASKVMELYQTNNVFMRCIVVDCSHANSAKIAVNQIKNALTAAQDNYVGGVMLESYLYSGSQCNTYGVSQTDECLDFDSTEKLIFNLYDILNKQNRY